ncbi:PQ loop repeat-domain-containing protein [Parachaetomium inaequale]|uniref:PQ loop repeat-domain-containing protein n=1 Tax=Parachaetomium inaequale TaxID=2588326 RepID=A0AAN6PG21_9PEZI|nr:PQ loop repeat-domain-containing protein [Parachaetomium inaequale]
MAPPTEPLNLDVEAISGICGSISIACWVVVFSPQIVDNFRRSSAEGLSIQFVFIWLLGDAFNILGAVLQGVLPTMIILAIYYTIADVVLLAQCFYYRGFTLRDDVPAPPPTPKRKRAVTGNENGNGHQARDPSERTGLLTGSGAAAAHHERSPYYAIEDHERRGSWTHLSPAVPFVSEEPVTAPPPAPTTWPQAFAFNSLAVIMVCAAGVAGWWLSRKYGRGGDGHGHGDGEKPGDNNPQDPLAFNMLGQVFGWLCAVLYLGSRLPQLLLNWRRKSTEGVSVLFFLFACLGNLTYVLSILAFDPKCEGDEGCRPGEAAHIFWQYILVNLSWLAGSAGTLLLDMGIFVQFFLYSKSEEYESSDEGSTDEESIGGEEVTWDQRPLLQRNHTGY